MWVLHIHRQWWWASGYMNNIPWLAGSELRSISLYTGLGRFCLIVGLDSVNARTQFKRVLRRLRASAMLANTGAANHKSPAIAILSHRRIYPRPRASSAPTAFCLNQTVTTILPFCWLDSIYRWASTMLSKGNVRSMMGFRAPDSSPL